MIDLNEVKIDIDKITNGDSSITNNQPLWVGSGIFDKLINVLNKNLDIEYKQGRISGTDYAKSYIELISLALDKSIAIMQADLSMQLQAKQTEAQIKQSEAQTRLYERQIAGFNDNLLLKLLQAQLDVFGALFASGNLEFDKVRELMPDALRSSNVTDVYNKAIDKYNKHVSNE